ncbi:hypothetical protein D3C80_984180 [compost metagenome]
MRRALAHQLQLTQVGFEPVADGYLELRGTGRQVGVDERRQLPASLIHQQHELVQGRPGVFCFVQQEADGTGEQQRQGADHQGAQQRYRQPACPLPGNQVLQLGGEHVDQFEHQQPGQQARQQLERQHQQQAGEDDDPTGQGDLALSKGHTTSKGDGMENRQSASLRPAGIVARSGAAAGNAVVMFL